MNNRQDRGQLTIRASLIELEKPQYQIPSIIALRRKLQAVQKEVDALALTQNIARPRHGRDRLRLEALRKNLRNRLRSVASHAKAILEGMPGIEDELRLPRAKDNDEAWNEAVARVIKNLRPHRRTLYANGLSAQSIVMLERAMADLKRRNAETQTALSQGSRATRDLPVTLRHARNLINSINDQIQVEFADDRHILDAWKSVKRVPGRIGRPRTRGRKKPKPDEMQ